MFMKKSILAVAVLLGTTSAFAQLESKMGEQFLPEEGDWAVSIDANPFLSYVGNLIGGADGNVDYCKYIMRLLPLEKVGLQSSVAESTSRAVTAKKSEMLLHALRKQVCVTYSSILSSLKLLFTGAKETSRWCQ